MRCLVTGGAGFIGSHLSRALLDAGHSVRVLDDFSTGKRENLAGLPVDLHVGDIACTVTADKACEGMDAVFHLAANPSVVRSIEAPLDCYRTNTLGTAVMLEAARRAGAQRFVFASSCAVYGYGSPPLKESAPPDPLSPYAASKLAGEAILLAASRISRETQPIVLRLFNVYGPGQNPDGEYSAVIPKFLKAINQGNQPVIYGDGQQTRDFVFVDDVVDAFILAATVDLQGQRDALPINIGSSKSLSLLDLVGVISQSCGKTAQLRFEATRTGDVRHSYADIEQAKSLLNWSPKTLVKDGLMQMSSGRA